VSAVSDSRRSPHYALGWLGNLLRELHKSGDLTDFGFEEASRMLELLRPDHRIQNRQLVLTSNPPQWNCSCGSSHPCEWAGWTGEDK
jgi:hypothetical protein